MESTLEFNWVKANKAQIEYCKENKFPHFAPEAKCWDCGRNIYGEGGIDVDKAGKTLITGCPFCNHSYCD